MFICLLLLGVIFFFLGYKALSSIRAPPSQSNVRPKKDTLDSGAEFDDVVTARRAESAELIKNYQTKKSFKHKVVMVIEDYNNNVQLLEQFLHNVLRQNVKVASLVLVTDGVALDKIALIKNTCVLNKVGGMSFMFKETDANTVVMFVYASGFAEFEDPDFLEKFIDGSIFPQHKHSIFKTKCGDVEAHIGKVYE
jgi:hypothetical protein